MSFRFDQGINQVSAPDMLERDAQRSFHRSSSTFNHPVGLGGNPMVDAPAAATDTGDDRRQLRQIHGLSVNMVCCDSCQRPLYLVHTLGSSSAPSSVVTLSRLAEAGKTPVFLPTTGAVYQLWPASAVLSRHEYRDVCEALARDHGCVAGA